MGSTTRVRAAISCNPTRETADDDIVSVDDDGEADARPTGLSPSPADRSRSLEPATPPRRTPTTAGSKTTIPTPREARPDFKLELRPLRSPLLGASQLVSFPPLINMLKFGGCSGSVRGRAFRRRGRPGERAPPPTVGTRTTSTSAGSRHRPIRRRPAPSRRRTKAPPLGTALGPVLLSPQGFSLSRTAAPPRRGGREADQ